MIPLRTLDHLSDTERKAAAFDRMIAGLAAVDAELHAIPRPKRTFADRHAALINSFVAIIGEIHRGGYDIPVHLSGAMRRLAQSRPTRPGDDSHWPHAEKMVTTQAGEPGEPNQKAEAEQLQKALKIKLGEFLKKPGMTLIVADLRVASELTNAGMPTKAAQITVWRKETGRKKSRAPGMAARLEEAEGIIGAHYFKAFHETGAETAAREATIEIVIGVIIDL